MLNSLDSDQAQLFVEPDLGPNCLQRLSADNTRKYFFFQNQLFENSFRNAIIVSNSSDSDQARHFVRPDLDPNCLQRLSADDTGRYFFFVSKSTFLKIISGTPSECQTVRMQIGPNSLTGLIWVRTVCKGYQQTTLEGTFYSFKINFFENLSGIPSEYQTVQIQIRPDFLSGLIWIQTV